MTNQKLTGEDFAALEGLDDWRKLLFRIHATFRAGGFEAAADLIRRIAEAAEAAGHHPDVHLRYPDVVEVVLATHSEGATTQLDVDLARTISAIAAEAGAGSEPLAAQALEIAIDALDIAAIVPCWKAVTGWKQVGEEDLVDPRGTDAIWFQQMDAPRPQRNRIHLDVTVPHEVAEERVAAALAAGGTLVSDAAAKSFWVLADAEGNEVCVCTWQDRD